MNPAGVCPLCGLANCPSVLMGVTCGPPVERRVEGEPRRQLDRRMFPRPEGRRRNGGRRHDDPAG